MESLVQTLRARTGLFTTAELMHTANVRFQTGWIGLSTYYKGLSRLLSADSTHHDAPGAADRWLCTLKVIGVAGDSKFGEEGDLGTAGSGGGIARACGGTRRASLGHRRVAGTAEPCVPVVVMANPRASVGDHSYP
jgi:hypothetical protein